MDRLQNLTFAYCIACIAVGIVRQITPQSSNSRRVIKAVTGLYILLTLLHCITGAAEQSAAFSLPAAGSAVNAQADYTNEILSQAQSSMEKACDSELAKAGLPCTVSLTLKSEENIVFVKTAQVCSESALSAEQQAKTEDILQKYAPAEIVFTAEGAKNGK